MAYLNSKLHTVDAILTTKGRELLARNDGSFRITQFALGDDEIDYTLYNPNHPSGSAYFGEAIELMPLLQAFPNESQVMQSKLVTLPRGTVKLPIVSIGTETIVLKPNFQYAFTPQTFNYQGANTVYESSGYVVTIHNMDLLSGFKGVGITDSSVTNKVVNQTASGLSQSQTGTSFTITGTSLDIQTSLTTTATITGRDSGAKIVVTIILQKA